VRGAAFLAVVLLAAPGCNRGEERFRSAEDGFSIHQLRGWHADRQKGSIVFRGPTGRGLAETTIVIRSVPHEKVRPHAREPRGLVEATATVLGGLPASVVSKASAPGHSSLGGGRFSVTFEPPGKEERYARTHVALAGKRRIFHLMHTAPEGALEKSAARFDDVVASLREME
jgi:hypothetical protein